MKAQIKALPGWQKGFTGIIGLDLSGNDEWYAIPEPNSRSNGVALNFQAFANYDQPKFFWKRRDLSHPVPPPPPHTHTISAYDP